jgi:large repetitive protein
VTASALQPLVSEAVAHWAAAGLSADALSSMANVKVVLTDLPGSYLGLADGNTIYIDRDAAGYGWFVDPTPQLNEEFAATANGQLRAVDSRAVDHIDLLTVVEHELGHTLGLADSSLDDLMNGTLGTGVRRNVAEADAVFAGHGSSWL